MNDYDSDTVAKIETAYTELITKGSTSHVFAQQAALKVVRASLMADGGDAKLAGNIQTALTTQSPSQQQAQAMISKIEAEIDNITVSGGDKVKLSVRHLRSAGQAGSEAREWRHVRMECHWRRCWIRRRSVNHLHRSVGTGLVRRYGIA